MVNDRELEEEWSGEFEDNFEPEEEFEEEDLLRALGGAGGDLGLGEEEFEEDEWFGSTSELSPSDLREEEWEEECEDEYFFRRISGAIKSAAPMLKKFAKVAAPMVGTVLGGPVGGIAGSLISRALTESEFESEFEDQFDQEDEISSSELASHELMAEYLAGLASKSENEEEAEALIGAATITMIKPRDRAALRSILPHLIRCTAILTRLLRRRRATRMVVRAIPSMVASSTRTMAQRSNQGAPVTRKGAAKVVGVKVGRTLSNPKKVARAVARNYAATRRHVGIVRSRPLRSGATTGGRRRPY